jgi:hypothetical protein
MKFLLIIFGAASLVCGILKKNIFSWDIRRNIFSKKWLDKSEERLLNIMIGGLYLLLGAIV